MGIQFSQMFPPPPNFTPKDIANLSGKVILITGASSGIGLELAKILYQKGAKVYMGCRSEEKARTAIQAIQNEPASDGHQPGELVFLPLFLDDLTTIKTTVELFQAKESKLDLLFNNAGISQPPVGSVSKQCHELQIATNCLGPFLFTRLLLPLFEGAVTTTESGATRVVWTSSQVVELSAPPEGIIMSEVTKPSPNPARNYTASKLGNWFLAVEMARRYGDRGIISIAQNPGAANTNLLRNVRRMRILSWPLLHSAVLAAHTALYAGFSSDVTLDNQMDVYVIPWGRVHPGVAGNLQDAIKKNGGTGRAREFWEFCDEKTRYYL